MNDRRIEARIYVTAIVSAMVMVVPGCLTNGSSDTLQVSIQLESDQFQLIQDVAGIIEIKNIGKHKASGDIFYCAFFEIYRMSDERNLPLQCMMFSDPSYEVVSFSPGERVERPFSFATPHYRNWESYPDEFPRGSYGISAKIVHQGERSDMAFFELTESS